MDGKKLNVIRHAHVNINFVIQQVKNVTRERIEMFRKSKKYRKISSLLQRLCDESC